MVGLHQILAGNVTHNNYYMLGTTTKLSIHTVSCSGFLKEIFFLDLGLAVTEID